MTPRAPVPHDSLSRHATRPVDGPQLIDALYTLSDTDTLLKFSRMPGSGVHRQLRFRWKGNTVLVNTWHTGRVHLQGYGARDLEKLLSGMAPSFSCAQARSVSPQSDGDSSGEGNSFSSFFWGLYLMLLWGVHLFVFGLDQLFQNGVRFFGNLRERISFGHTRRTKVRGAGSQAALRRGARSRKAALAVKARARGCVRNAIISSMLSLTGMRIPLASWLLDRSLSSLVTHLSILLILFHIICGLRCHGKLHIVTESVPVLMNLTVPGSSLPINQDGAIFQNAPYEGAIPICQFLVHLSRGVNFIAARRLVAVSSLISALVLVALVHLLGLPAFPVPGVLGASRCRTHARVLPRPVVSVPGALGVIGRLTLVRVLPSSCYFLPSCDFTRFRRPISNRKIGAVALLFFLLGASTPIMWQTGLVGVRVEEASHPGPAHPTPEGAPIALNVPEILIQVPGSDPSLLAVHSGAPVPGSSSTQAPHPYVAPPPPYPVRPSRPSRFCTPPLPCDSSRHLSGSPAPPASSQPLSGSPLLCSPSGSACGFRSFQSILPGRVLPGSCPPFSWVSFLSVDATPHRGTSLGPAPGRHLFRVALEPRFWHV